MYVGGVIVNKTVGNGGDWRWLKEPGIAAKNNVRPPNWANGRGAAIAGPSQVVAAKILTSQQCDQGITTVLFREQSQNLDGFVNRQVTGSIPSCGAVGLVDHLPRRIINYCGLQVAKVGPAGVMSS